MSVVTKTKQECNLFSVVVLTFGCKDSLGDVLYLNGS